MKRIGFLMLILFTCMAPAAWPHSHDSSQPQIVTFDPPGAGTAAGQGTYVNGINSQGSVMGWFIDASYVNHGFVRAHDGTITVFDVPGAGTAAGQGTVAWGMNSRGDITGYYVDSRNANHGFLRTAGCGGHATIATFDAPNAGSGSGQGTEGANINDSGTISGLFSDAGNTWHGYMRNRDGSFISFDIPGATPTGLYLGTFYGLTASGSFVGYYSDGDGVSHGWLRAKDGDITKIDGPGIGTAAGSINSQGEIVGWTWDTDQSLSRLHAHAKG